MKIAIDALGIHYYGGGRSATLNLLRSLFELDTINEYLVILSKHEPSLETPSGNITQWISPFKHRVAVRVWAQILFPFKLRNYDIVHFIKNLGAFFIQAKVVVSLYDMTTLVLPELFPIIDVWYWKHIEKYTVRTANVVVPISNNTARDITHFYKVPLEKQRVIYPAHSKRFRPASSDEIERVRSHYHLPNQYVLHVGRIDRKKNLSLLVKAFSILLKINCFDGKLVFVGEEYKKSRDFRIYDLIEDLNLKNHVLFTGTVPDRDLPAIYSAATVSVFCSRHEGFGIVGLEALACGTPLIVTPAGAVLEAVGNAAIVLDVEEPEVLADYLFQVISDSNLRESLRAKGLHQSQKFSWETSAMQTLQLYEEIHSAK